LGHYIADGGIQLLSAISYQSSQFENLTSSKMTFFPGVSLEMKSNYGIAAFLSLDLVGKNAEKTTGVSLAWTILL